MSDTRNLENNLVKIIAAVGFLIFAYFAVRIFIGDIYTDKLIESYSEPTRQMENEFRAQIAAETDAYQALKMGTQFAKAQNNDLALAAYQKATDLDDSYRDAWILRGMGELQNDQPLEAIKSLKKAEGIDPINPRTYELLAIAYRESGDEESAKKAEEKWEYLTKTSD